MFPRNAAASNAMQRKLCGTSAAPEPKRDISNDPDKAAVMRWIAWLVADGLAEWETLVGGDVQVHFQSGATFLLAKSCIVRLA